MALHAVPGFLTMWATAEDDQVACSKVRVAGLSAGHDSRVGVAVQTRLAFEVSLSFGGSRKLAAKVK